MPTTATKAVTTSTPFDAGYVADLRVFYVCQRRFGCHYFSSVVEKCLLKVIKVDLSFSLGLKNFIVLTFVSSANFKPQLQIFLQ